MLKAKGIEFTIKTLGVDYQRDELMALVPGARSLPQVFVGGQHIGDHIALGKYLKDK